MAPRHERELLEDRVQLEGAFHEIMTGAFDDLELSLSGNEGEGRLQFVHRCELVFGSTDEQGRRMELRKMRGSQLLRFLGRMQRIGKQQERFH